MAGFTLAVAAAALAAPPVSAQIVCRTDGNGNQVFTNQVQPARLAGSRTGPPAKALPHAAQPNAASHPRLDGIVEDTAQQYGVDPRLVQAVVRVESAWNPAAVSPKDAMGLMQLIPATAQRFEVRNVFNPAENVRGGVRYLAELLSRYRGDLPKALAAYYAGERRVDRAGGVPTNEAIRAYVHQVLRLYQAGEDEAALTPVAIRRFTDNQGRVVYTNE